MKTKNDIEKAAEELEATLAKSQEDGDGEDTGTQGRLAKAIDGLTGMLDSFSKAFPPRKGKDECDDDEDEDDERDDPEEDEEEDEEMERRGKRPPMRERMERSYRHAEREVYEDLSKSEAGEYVEEMIDSTPVLEALIDGLAKSEARSARTFTALETLAEHIELLARGEAAIMKSLQAMYGQLESFQATEVSGTSPGVMIINTAADGEAGDCPTNLKDMVKSAVAEGKLESRYLLMFDTRKPEDIWAILPKNALL